MGSIISMTYIIISGGYLIILTALYALGNEKEAFENTMRENDENHLLHWKKSQPIENYMGSYDGILYTFQKPVVKGEDK